MNHMFSPSQLRLSVYLLQRHKQVIGKNQSLGCFKNWFVIVALDTYKLVCNNSECNITLFLSHSDEKGSVSSRDNITLMA